VKINILLSAILVTALLAGCKKDHNRKPDKQEVIEPVNDPLLFGKTRVTDAYYVETTWQGKKRDTSLVSYRHKGLIVSGFYQRSVVSPGGVGHGIDFYGNEAAEGNGSRVCQFLATSVPFIASTGRTVDPSYVEWAQGNTSYNGDTYIVAMGGYPGRRASSYYYRIDGQTRKPTFHPLAQTPNGNGYAWFCGTSKGLIVSNSLSPDNKKTYLSVFREDTWIQDYQLDAQGYINIDIKNVFAKDDDHLIVTVTGYKQGASVSGLFYFTINLLDHTIKRYQSELPEVGFYINKGAYAKNTVYLPYYEYNTNKCAYVTLKIDQNSGKLVTKKFDLPVKPGITYGSATVVATNGNNVYVAGEQGGLACFWKNDKLMEIENKEATRSFMTDIAVFD
jgi:hypothetical protein